MATSNIARFYKQVDDFKHKITKILEQLGKMDEIKELNKHYNKLLIVKNAASKPIIEMFYKKGIIQCAKQILTQDEEFFMGKIDEIEPDEHVNEHDLMLIGHIKSIWPFLPEDVRQNIWNYIKIIAQLAELVVGDTVLKDMATSLK